jgi:predicted dehydrogenase
MVDFHTRWSPPIYLAQQDIQQGKLGKILSAYYRLNDTVIVPTEMLSWAAQSSILWFLGSHTVDTLRFLLQDEVKRVYSVSHEGHLKSLGVDVPDLYQSILEFESGAIATIENSWVIPNSSPKVNDIKVNVTGTKGMYSMDLTNNQAVERYLEAKADHPDILVNPMVQEMPVGFAYESIRAFVDALALQKPIRATLEDGIKVSQVILAIFESAAQRSPVDVDYSL